MFCINCGEKLSLQAIYCQNCGAKKANSEVKEIKPEVKESHLPTEVNPINSIPSEIFDFRENDTNRGKKICETCGETVEIFSLQCQDCAGQIFRHPIPITKIDNDFKANPLSSSDKSGKRGVVLAWAAALSLIIVVLLINTNRNQDFVDPFIPLAELNKPDVVDPFIPLSELKTQSPNSILSWPAGLNPPLGDTAVALWEAFARNTGIDIALNRIGLGTWHEQTLEEKLGDNFGAKVFVNDLGCTIYMTDNNNQSKNIWYDRTDFEGDIYPGSWSALSQYPFWIIHVANKGEDCISYFSESFSITWVVNR